MTTKETITGETAQNSPAVAVRLDFDAHAAGFACALASLDHAATKELDRVAFDPRLRELVRIRASQLNGCAYCIDMHTTDARAIGETEQRLYALTAWRDTLRSSGPLNTSTSLAPSSVSPTQPLSAPPISPGARRLAPGPRSSCATDRHRSAAIQT